MTIRILTVVAMMAVSSLFISSMSQAEHHGHHIKLAKDDYPKYFGIQYSTLHSRSASWGSSYCSEKIHRNTIFRCFLPEYRARIVPSAGPVEYDGPEKPMREFNYVFKPIACSERTHRFDLSRCFL